MFTLWLLPSLSHFRAIIIHVGLNHPRDRTGNVLAESVLVLPGSLPMTVSPASFLFVELTLLDRLPGFVVWLPLVAVLILAVLELGFTVCPSLQVSTISLTLSLTV